jgi:hypothetical protein
VAATAMLLPVVSRFFFQFFFMRALALLMHAGLGAIKVFCFLY